MTNAERERAIAAHGGIVRRVAWRVRAIASHHWEFEDLVGYGWVAFLRALDRYRPGRDRGKGLEVYLAFKVRYELLDRLREIDHSRRIGPKPVMVRLALARDPVQMPCGENGVAVREAWELIERLPPRWADLMRLRYREDLTFGECGRALGVGESRAVQIHGAAIAKLQEMARG